MPGLGFEGMAVCKTVLEASDAAILMGKAALLMALWETELTDSSLPTTDLPKAEQWGARIPQPHPQELWAR